MEKEKPWKNPIPTPSAFYLKTMSTITTEISDRIKKGSYDDETEKEVLSLKLKAFRAEHRLTQIELADKIGVSKAQIIRWEQRKNRPNKIAVKRMEDLGIL